MDIKKILADLIREEYKHVDAVVGVATGGIAQGALVADCLELPFAYVSIPERWTELYPHFVL